MQWVSHDFEAPSHMTVRLPKVGQLVGAQPEERQKEGGSWLGVQGLGSHWPVRGKGGRQARAAWWLLPECESWALVQGGMSDLGREEDRMEDPVAKEDLERRVMLGCLPAEGHSQQTLVKRRS